MKNNEEESRKLANQLRTLQRRTRRLPIDDAEETFQETCAALVEKGLTQYCKFFSSIEVKLDLHLFAREGPPEDLLIVVKTFDNIRKKTTRRVKGPPSMRHRKPFHEDILGTTGLPHEHDPSMQDIVETSHKLPDTIGRPFRMWLEGFTTQEIAKKENCSARTIRRRRADAAIKVSRILGVSN